MAVTRVKASTRRVKSGRIARVKPHVRHTTRKRRGPAAGAIAKTLGPLSRKPYVGVSRVSPVMMKRLYPGYRENYGGGRIQLLGPERKYDRPRFVKATKAHWQDAWVVQEYERASGRKAKIGKMRELRRS